MKNLISYAGLFVAGILSNFNLTIIQATEECSHRKFYGFPFFYYERCEGLVSTKQIFWNGLYANLFVAVLFSFIVGLIFKFVWSKFQTNNLR